MLQQAQEACRKHCRAQTLSERAGEMCGRPKPETDITHGLTAGCAEADIYLHQSAAEANNEFRSFLNVRPVLKALCAYLVPFENEI